MEGDDLDAFLAKVDEVNSVIKGMSQGERQSIEKADNLIKKVEASCADTRVKHDATRINPSPGSTQATPEVVSQQAFMAQIEADAAARRKRRDANRRDSEPLRLEGNVLFKAGQYADAADKYSAALQLYPDSLVLYTNRAQARLKMGRYSEALEDTKWALRLHDKHPKALLRRGLALRGLGRYDEAIEALEKARKAVLAEKRDPMDTYLKETRELKAVHERDLKVHDGLPKQLLEKNARVYRACEKVVEEFSTLQEALQLSQREREASAMQELKEHNDTLQHLQCRATTTPDDTVSPGQDGPRRGEEEGGEDEEGQGDCKNDDGARMKSSDIAGPVSSPLPLPADLNDMGAEQEAWLVNGTKKHVVLLKRLTVAADAVVHMCESEKSAKPQVTLAETHLMDFLRVHGGPSLMERITAVDALTHLCREMTPERRLKFVADRGRVVDLLVSAADALLSLLNTLCSSCDVFCTALASRGDAMRRLSLLPHTPLPQLQEKAVLLMQTIVQSENARNALQCYGLVGAVWELVERGNVLMVPIDRVLHVLTFLLNAPSAKNDLLEKREAILERAFSALCSPADHKEGELLAYAGLILQSSCEKIFVEVHERFIPRFASAITAFACSAAASGQPLAAGILGPLFGALANLGLSASYLTKMTSPPAAIPAAVVSFVKESTTPASHSTTRQGITDTNPGLVRNMVAVLARLCACPAFCTHYAVADDGALLKAISFLLSHSSDETSHSHILRAMAKILACPAADGASRTFFWKHASYAVIAPFLSSKNENIVGNACLVIGNACLEEKELGGVPVSAVDALLHVAKTSKTPAVQKNAAMAIARLCKDPDKLQRVRDLKGFSVLHARS